MSEVAARLSPLLDLDLRGGATIDNRGRVKGRVYLENPHFNSEFTLLRLSRQTLADGNPGDYEVKIVSETLPGVNGFTRSFPGTKSNRRMKALAAATKEAISKFEGVPVRVDVGAAIAPNAALVILAVAFPTALFCGILGFFYTDSIMGFLEGGLLGGGVAAALMTRTIFLEFD